ncbi:MAG: hypothetical protein IJC89_03885 [Clostridia bacterium]|nr:hypothetical protein [Clostridia bacterium]
MLHIFCGGIAIGVIALLVGEFKKEYGILVSLCGGIVLLIWVLPQINNIISLVESAAEKADINTSYVGIVIKCSGIACICAICSGICRDMGQGALGTKLELAGRITIMVTALPAIGALLSLIEGII